MASIGYNSPSKTRNAKLRSAKKFLSLQVSQTGQALSKEMNGILQAQIMARKRKKVINEIFTTEKTYQQQIHTLTTVFLGELRKTNIIPQNALNIIFSNIEGIEAINRELLNHMETLGVGDAFLAMAPFIKLYSTYANNFERASSMLKEWEKKSPEFLSFITRQEALEECKGLNLRALLITPVQRVPRYKLLLESLLNKTARDYPDFSKLEEATEEIAKVAEHINENIRQHENFQKMLGIQKSLTGEGAPKILAPGRFFIKEGPLLKACKRGSQERMFFLFSDILIYAKKSGTMDRDQSTYSCQRVFPLNECEVEQMFGSSLDTDGSADVGSLFKISCQEKTLLVYSKSKLEASSWFNAIKDAIGKLRVCRASLRRMSRGDGSFEKSGTPLRRATLLKNKILRTPKDIKSKKTDFDCLSPASFIKDSLYPLRKEIRKNAITKNDTKKNNTPKRYNNKLPEPKTRKTQWGLTESKGSNVNQNASGTSTVNDTSNGSRALEDSNGAMGSGYNEDDEYSSLIVDDDHEDYDDDEDDDDEGLYEPSTPSGLIDSDSQARMINTTGTDSGSVFEYSDSDTSSDESADEQETEDEHKGVATRGQKRKIDIDDKENQLFFFSPHHPAKKRCILPKLLCGGINRSPNTRSRLRKRRSK